MCNHYLIEPTACTPASGWEKGQVENQVGNVREWLFTPKLKCANLAELNAHLAARCLQLARERMHPEQTERPIIDVWEEERVALRATPAPFDGYAEQSGRVSSTCRDCPKFCVTGPYFPQEGCYGDQEGACRRAAEGC